MQEPTSVQEEVDAHSNDRRALRSANRSIANSRAGVTIDVLVERLTSPEEFDEGLFKAFIATFETFMTIDELFDHLVDRYNIQPPEGLPAGEREDWVKSKQEAVRARVLNTFKAIISEEYALLGDGNTQILDRLESFLFAEDAITTKELLNLVDAARTRQKTSVANTITNNTAPTTNLKLKDIDPIEMARQLTLIESSLFRKTRVIDYLRNCQRSPGSGEVLAIVRISNQICDWVVDSILGEENPEERTATIEYFITVADHCRSLNNFSMMSSILCGLRTPAVGRLNASWERVSEIRRQQYQECEEAFSPTRGFQKYRAALASVSPPCLPFAGLLLSTLQFLQDSSPSDVVPEDGGPKLVYFDRRQKAYENIADFQKLQGPPFYDFEPLPAVQEFIRESTNLGSSVDAENTTTNRHLDQMARSWELEPPPEGGDSAGKIERLLRESGFL